MVNEIEQNNFISFGVLSRDGVADVSHGLITDTQITFAVNDKTVFNISVKGVPVWESFLNHPQFLSIPFRQIAGFVQNVCNPEALTIYYNKWRSIVDLIPSTYLPQHFSAINAKSCSIIVSSLNSSFGCDV